MLAACSSTIEFERRTVPVIATIKNTAAAAGDGRGPPRESASARARAARTPDSWPGAVRPIRDRRRRAHRRRTLAPSQSSRRSSFVPSPTLALLLPTESLEVQRLRPVPGGNDPLLDRVLVEQALQNLAPAIQPGHHGTGRTVHDLGDLL